MSDKYATWTRDDLARLWHRVGGNPYRKTRAELISLMVAYDALPDKAAKDEFVASIGRAEDMPNGGIYEPREDATAYAEQVVEETQPPARVEGERDIASLLAKVTAEVAAVGKTGRNTQQNYSYRTYDDIAAAVRLPLAKHGVAMTFTITNRDMEIRRTQSGGQQYHVVLTVDFTFTGPPRARTFVTDTNAMTVTTIGEGMDNLDKATNKALVAATKYMLSTVFLISSGDDTDSDSGRGGAETTVRPPAEGYADYEEEAVANREVRAMVRDLAEPDREEIVSYVRDQGFTYSQPWPRALVERVWQLANIRAQAVDGPVDGDELSQLGEEPFS